MRWVAAATDRRFGPFESFWAYLSEPCATWPARDRDRYTGPFSRRTSAPILIVGTRFDPASPYQNALAVTRELPRSRPLTLDGWGHVALGKSTCLAGHIDRYLVTGASPRPGTTCGPDQRPFGRASLSSLTFRNLDVLRAEDRWIAVGPVEFDDIIVGGGSAGAVLAARLSEDPARRVLLLEAGPDYATLESTPDDLRDAWRMSLRAHDWGLTAEAVPGRAIPYPRGRVIGGSSAVNATIALRGVPADYDEWAALGNDEWSWAKVLPHFRRLEDDPMDAGDVHGRGGPVAIRRWRPDELIPVQDAFFQVCRRLGFPEVADHNHPESSGVGPFPQNRRGRLRLSTALAYVLPARHRPNLAIRPQCLVNRILFAEDRAVGVDIDATGGSEQVRGRRITLAAGAIGSPAILLRSGIGPRAALAGLGIEPVADLPGVGAGLADHPVTRLLLVPRPGSCDRQTPLAQVVVRYTAPSSGEFNDMQQVMFSHVDVAGIGGEHAVTAVGTPLAIGLPVALERPHARGRLLLASSDPRIPPVIQLNLAAQPQDLRRLVAGVRLAWQIAHQPEIARHTQRVALLSEETVASDDALAAYVRATVSTQFHPCGTARMGPPDDAMAVLDQHCRLRGVPNLRVVDASIMPTVPRANINLTCIMIGEHVSDWMRDDE